MKKFKLYSCLGLMFISVLVPLRALAYDESFYSSNDILFYNPDDTGPIDSENSEAPNNLEEEINLNGFATSGPVIVNTTSLDGSDALGKIIYFYTHKGLSLAQAAGIAGNFWRESNFVVDALNPLPTSKAYGIAQWLGDRKKRLFEFTGTNSPTLAQQLEFSWHELYGTNGKNGLEIDAYEKLLATKTPAEAALSFYIEYERAADTPEVIQLRIDYARAIYKRMGGIE